MDKRKTPDAVVTKVKERSRAGQNDSVIGRELGMSRHTVAKILNRPYEAEPLPAGTCPRCGRRLPAIPPLDGQCVACRAGYQPAENEVIQ
jgi:hypothetical protein